PLYQFPWRFAGPAALFAALAVALLVSWTSASLGRRAALVLELLLFALCTLQALPRLLQYEPLPAPVRDRLEPALAPAALLRSPLPATVGEECPPRGSVAQRDRSPLVRSDRARRRSPGSVCSAGSGSVRAGDPALTGPWAADALGAEHLAQNLGREPGRAPHPNARLHPSSWSLASVGSRV